MKNKATKSAIKEAGKKPETGKMEMGMMGKMPMKKGAGKKGKGC